MSVKCRRSKPDARALGYGGWNSAVAIASILLSLLVAGCSSKVEKRWVEEVRLHDERIITIDRYSQSARTGFPNSRIGNVLYQEIHYSPVQFAWSNPAKEKPISFDLIDDYIYFVTIPVQNLGYFCRGKPKGTYKANFYRWKRGRMERLSQQQAPVDSLRMNITGFSKGPFSEHKAYLSAGDVNSANGRLSYRTPLTLRHVFEEKKKYYLLCP